jgi:hypothetical protein
MATRNPWLKFKALMQGSGRSVVTVISNNGDGTSTVEFRTGGQIKVSGETVTAGNKALVSDGMITQQVPNLISTVIEI